MRFEAFSRKSEHSLVMLWVMWTKLKTQWKEDSGKFASQYKFYKTLTSISGTTPLPTGRTRASRARSWLEFTSRSLHQRRILPAMLLLRMNQTTIAQMVTITLHHPDRVGIDLKIQRRTTLALQRRYLLATFHTTLLANPCLAWCWDQALSHPGPGEHVT